MKFIAIVSLCLPILLLTSCGKDNPKAVWQNTLKDSAGVTMDYAVCGDKAGEPVGIVLVRYRPGEPNAPKFTWGMQGDHFVIDNNPIPGGSGIHFYVNSADGTAKRIRFPDAETRKLFSQSSNPTAAELLDFWNENVAPQVR
jgi:hypothetical protein